MPVFWDIEETTLNIDSSKIEEGFTGKIKAIVPVSLYVQPVDMGRIQAIADQFNLKLIIDRAQSFGSTFMGNSESVFGDVCITSFFLQSHWVATVTEE